jgi:hypothetical protein
MTKEVLPFNEEEDNELVSLVEDLQQKSNPRETVPSAYIPFQTVVGSTQGTSNHKIEDTRKELLELHQKNSENENFSQKTPGQVMIPFALSDN